jgi:hypothetical protein
VHRDRHVLLVDEHQPPPATCQNMVSGGLDTLTQTLWHTHTHTHTHTLHTTHAVSAPLFHHPLPPAPCPLPTVPSGPPAPGSWQEVDAALPSSSPEALLVRAVLIRAAFGGTEGDVAMIMRFAGVCGGLSMTSYTNAICFTRSLSWLRWPRRQLPVSGGGPHVAATAANAAHAAR